MKELTSMEAVKSLINDHEVSFIYVLTDSWSVCHGLLPQVEEVMKEFPKIEMGLVNAGKVEEIAGFLMAFTVPVLVLYVDGREYLREARIVPVEKFRENVAKIYNGIYGE